MRTTKNFLMSILLVLVVGVSGICVACGEEYSKANILIPNDYYEITLNEKGEVEQDLLFKVNIENVDDVSLYYYLKNEGIIKVDLIKNYGTQFEVKVQPVKPGECVVTLFLAEDSSVKKDIKIRVIQPVTSLAVESGFEYYAKLGEKSFLNLGSKLIAQPASANLDALKYSIVQSGLTGVQLSENGMLDATACTRAGKIQVRISASEQVYVDFPVNIIKAVSKEDIRLAYSYVDNRGSETLLRNGTQYAEVIELIKTGSVSPETAYLDYYNKVTIEFGATLPFNNYTVQYKVTGTTIGGAFVNGEWTTLADNNFELQGLSLGISKLQIRVNNKGAEEFFNYVEFSFDVSVIDAPTSIEVVDPSSSSSKNITFDNEINKYLCSVFNTYAQGAYGQAMKFNIRPTSVAESNANLILEFVDSIAEKILFLDENGYIIEPVNNKIKIKASDIIYLKAIDSDLAFSPEYTFNVYSEFSQRFVRDGGTVVSTSVFVKVYQGINYFRVDDGTERLFLDLTGVEPKSYQVRLDVGVANAKTNAIYFESSNNEGIVEIRKDNDLAYTITALKEGEVVVRFYSGNGYLISLPIKVFVPIKSIEIQTPNELENGFVGHREFSEDGKLEKIAVQVNGAFNFDIIANNGGSATIYDIKYRLVGVGGLGGSTIVELQAKTRTIIVKGVGSVEVYVTVFGYNQNGEQNAVSGDAKYVRFTVEGYIPVETIQISSAFLNLKDPSTVAFNKVLNHSRANLSVRVYPTNATYNVENINWSTNVPNVCILSKNSGQITEVSAIAINNELQNMVVFTISASLSIYGRVYTSTCEVKIEKAVKVEKIFIDELPYMQINFDSRKGLSTAENLDERNSFHLNPRIVPANAFDKSLQYDIVYSRNTNGESETVFKVTPDGKVYPIAGGMGVIRIASQDCFRTSQEPNENVCRYVTVVVADGKSEDTAFGVSNSLELQAIGDNEESRSNYYKLTNNISLSGNWTPIGNAGNPFKGWFSGANVVFEREYDGNEFVPVEKEKIQYKITGLSFNASNIASGTDAYFGLFGFAKCVGIENVVLELGTISINASSNNGALYFGGLVGLAESNFTPTAYIESTEVLSVIRNCSVSAKNDIAITASNGENYIGGLIGQLKDVKVENSKDLMVSFKNFNITATRGANLDLNVGGLIGCVEQTYYVVGEKKLKVGYPNLLTGANLMKLNAVNEECEIIYSGAVSNLGYDVYVNQILVELSGEGNINSSAVGGLIGKTKLTQSQQTISIQYSPAEIQEINSGGDIVDFSVYADIQAGGINNVGGIVGSNELVIDNVYFDGKVTANNNVGGIAGENKAEIKLSRVCSTSGVTISGVNNVGGIAGNFTEVATIHNKLIQNCYVSGVELNTGVSATTNAGSIIGLGAGVIIYGTYSDISTPKVFNVANSENLFTIFGSYFIGSAIGSGTADIYLSYLVSVENATYNATYYNFVGETITGENSQNDFMELTGGSFGTETGLSAESFFKMPKDIGEEKEYENINYSYSVIVLNVNTYLFNVVFNEVEVFLNNDQTRSVILNDEEKELLLFYYGLDSSFEATLNAQQKAKAKAFIAGKNKYKLPELFTLNLIPKPFSSVVMNVRCLTLLEDKISTVAQIDENGELKILGEGAFRLVVESKLNPAKKVEVTIYVTGYISDFGLYASNSNSSTEYSLERIAEWRKNTTKEVFAIYNATIETSGKDVYSLGKSSNFGLMFIQNFTAENTILADLEDGSNILEVVKDGDNYYFVSLPAEETSGRTGVLLQYVDVLFDTKLEIGQNNIESEFKMEIDGVHFVGSLINSNGFGKDANKITWEVSSIPENATITTSGNTIVITKDGTTTTYYAVNKSAGTDQANAGGTSIENSLYIKIENYGTTDQNLTYYYAELVQTIAYEDSPNVVKLFSEKKIDLGNSILVKPYVNLNSGSGANKIIPLNLSTVFAKSFGYKVFEGAKNIYSDLDSVVYSPTDAVNMKIYLISDTAVDGVNYVDEEANKDLIVEMTEATSRELPNNLFEFVYDVTIRLADTFEARNIKNSKQFSATFSAITIASVEYRLSLTFMPQRVQRLDLLNYNRASVSNGVDTGNQLGFTLDAGTSPSAYITPNGSGIISIDFYPAYAEADIIQITSNEINGIYVDFLQLYSYGTTGYVILPAPPQSKADGTLLLERVSTMDGLGNKVFNGKMYVRTYLKNGVDAESIFTITVSALKKNSAGNGYDVILSSYLNLEVSGYPYVSIKEENGVYSYVQETEGQNIQRNLVIAGRTFDLSVSLHNLDAVRTTPIITPIVATGNGSLGAVKILNSDAQYQVINNAFVYNYQIFVGPDYPVGETIKISWKTDYLSEGKVLTAENEIEFIVVKYVVDSINLSSPFKDTTDLAYLNVYSMTDVKVSSVKVTGMETNILNVPGSVNMADEKLFEMLVGFGGWYDRENERLYPITYEEINKKFQFVVRNGDNVVELVRDANEFGKFSSKEEGKLNFAKDLEYKLGMKTIEQLLKDDLNENYLVAERPNEASQDFLTVKYAGQEEFKSLSTSSLEPLSVTYFDKGSGIALTGNEVSLDNKLKITYEYTALGDIPTTAHKHKYERIFDLNLINVSSLYLPQEIDSQVAFEKMLKEGVADDHYILMRDLILTNFTPKNANFASLDGNGHTLTIQSFSKEFLEQVSVNLGLFSTIANKTVIKNLIVDYSLIREIKLDNATSVKVGLFAVENKGVITNCQVKVDAGNSNTSQTHSKVNELNGKDIYTTSMHELKIIANAVSSTVPEISLFVCNNSSSITHSRVMNTNSDSLFKLNASGKLAGFAVSNSGHISTSYASNIVLENSYPVIKSSMTAGFAITNSGNISQSFVSGKNYNSINSCDVGYIKSNGVVTGFVYENSSELLDCYSNIPLISNASVAGFLFKNTLKGTVENCYSASMLTANSAVHLPFIGVDDLSNVQNENAVGINNCYYLEAPANYAYGIPTEDYPAVAISNAKFSKENSFGGFSFGNVDPTGVVMGQNTERASGESVWYLSTNGPILYSAQKIAVSRREPEINKNGEKVFNYIADDNGNGKEGSISNPLIISNAEEFNYYISTNALYVDYANKKGGFLEGAYIRIVNNIDFSDVNSEMVSPEIALIASNIEGNGFTISNVILKIKSTDNDSGSEKVEDTIGLFSYIRNSNIRNLNIEISQAICENVRVLGGLAGVMIDSNVASVKVSSSSVMSARFVAGGVVGGVFGDSTLNKVEANASININFKPSSSLVLSKDYISGTVTGEIEEIRQNGSITARKIVGIENIKDLSYAGGIAGIIDSTLVHSSTILNADPNSIRSAYEKRMAIGGENFTNLKVSGEISLDAQYVGGIVGYLGMYSHISNAVFELQYKDHENKQVLTTEYCVGGIVGINYGMISRSAVKHSDYYQTIVEQEIKSYLSTGQDVRNGKKNLFKGDLRIAGGLVGLNYYGAIAHSYSTISVEDNTPIRNIPEQYLGGIVGWTYSGYFDSIYATGNVSTNKSAGYVGGIAGRYTYMANDKINQLGIKFDNVYSLNFWERATIDSTFNQKSSHSGVLFGYASRASEIQVQDIAQSFKYMHSIIIGGDEICGDLFDATTHIIGTNLDETTWAKSAVEGHPEIFEYNFVKRAESGLTYAKFFTDESTSAVEDFLDQFVNYTTAWNYKGTDMRLPRLKISAVSIEVEVSDLFTLLSVLQNDKYKSIQVADDIDFDITKYSVDSNYDILYGGEVISSGHIKLDGGMIKTQEKPISAGGITFGTGGTLNLQSYTGGTFVGKLQSSKVNAVTKQIEQVKFKNINLANADAIGFFDSLNRAVISNIDFEFIASSNSYNATDTTRPRGLVAREDYSSTFMNINVGVYEKDTSALNNIQASNTIATLTHNIKTFGGFVGSSTGSTIFSNCNLNAKLTYSNATSETGTNKYLGGIVGKGASLTFDSCKVVTNLAFNDVSTGVNSVYIGGFVGNVEYLIVRGSGNEVAPCVEENELISSTLSNSNDTLLDSDYFVGGIVGANFSGGSGSISNAKVKGKMAFTNHVALTAGGIAGQISNTTFENVEVGEAEKPMQITATISKGSVENLNSFCNNKLYLGGLIGNAIVTRLNSENMGNTAKIWTNISVTLNGLTTDKFSIGGVIGRFEANTSTKYDSKNIFVVGLINFVNKRTATETSDQTIRLGGVLGENVLNENDKGTPKEIGFNNVNSFVDISAKVVDESNEVDKTKSVILYSGGFLGGITSNQLSTGASRGKLALEDCFIAGSICADEMLISSGAVGGVAGLFEGIIGAENSKVIVATSIIVGENLAKGLTAKDKNNNYSQSFFVGALVASSTDINVNGETFIVEDVVGISLNPVESAVNTNYLVTKYADWLATLTNDERLEYQRVAGEATGTLLKPNTNFGNLNSNRFNLYNREQNGTISTELNVESNDIKIVAFNNYEFNNIESPVFSSAIPSKTIVSNILLTFTDNKVNGLNYLASENNGTIIGVYLNSIQGEQSNNINYSTNNSALLLGSNKGAIYDVMINAEISISAGNTFAFISHSQANSVVYNVQVLGSLNIGDGTINETINETGGTINFVSSSVDSSNLNYLKNITIATNVVSNVSYTAQVGAGQYQDRLENVYYDPLSMQMETKNGDTNANIVEIPYSANSKALGLTKIYSQNSQTITLYDVYNTTNRKATHKVDENYGYEYLSRFSAYIPQQTTNIANNYSKLQYLIKNGKNATLINNINRNIYDNVQNTDFSSTKAYGGKINEETGNIDYATLNGQNDFGIYGIKVYNTSVGNKNYSTLKGIFPNNLAYAQIQNITFSFASLSSETASNNDFAGTLASTATNSKFTNVNIQATGTLLGLAVGGAVGKAENCEFNVVKVSNFTIRGTDGYAQNTENGVGIAGGLTAYSVNCLVKDCEVGEEDKTTSVVGGNANTVTGNSDGRDAGPVGGFSAIDNGSEFNGNELIANVYAGDASNGVGNKGDGGDHGGGVYNGHSGKIGGDTYIGGIVGRANCNVSAGRVYLTFDFNNISKDSIFQTNIVEASKLLSKVDAFPRLHTEKIIIGYEEKTTTFGMTIRIPVLGGTTRAAGNGSSGTEGQKGHNHCGVPCEYGNAHCHKMDDGGNGGNGGNGGKTYVGLQYGRKANESFVKNNRKTDSIACSLGGSGGDGGDYPENELFYRFTHYGYAGNGGSSGYNGNGEGRVNGTNSSGSRNHDKGKGGICDGDSECYLQS